MTDGIGKNLLHGELKISMVPLLPVKKNLLFIIIFNYLGSLRFQTHYLLIRKHV